MARIVCVLFLTKMLYFFNILSYNLDNVVGTAQHNYLKNKEECINEKVIRNCPRTDYGVCSGGL